jgi:hypothetical protein
LPRPEQEVKNEHLSDEKVCILPVGTNGTPYLSFLRKVGGLCKVEVSIC